MNEIQYDIIDELYFVTSYGDIARALNLAEDELCRQLAELIKMGYVKALYPDPDTEVSFDESSFYTNCPKYFYLATKEGLISHNSR